MNSYELHRAFFDWCFENPEKVTTNHVALYCFSVEHCNRLGWKKNFGLPTTMAMEAIGIKSYNTYIKTFNDLINWGFITLIEKSRNQYSANIIALSKFNKATNKALDKALITHSIKQRESTQQSNDSIDKQKTNKQSYNKTNKQEYDFSRFNNSAIEIYWKDWKEYKLNQHKEKFKSLKTEQIAIDKLGELSNWKTDTAKKIIEQSISNLWKGLFELKQNQNNNYGNTNYTTSINPKQTLSERMAEVKRRASERRNQQSNSTGTSIEPFSDFEDVS